MKNIYKIETYCEESKTQLAEFITQFGGQYIIRGLAIITDHVFNESQTKQAIHLVARITDNLTDDDLYSWEHAQKQAA